MRAMTSIDLFAGAGGLTEGLRRAGFQSLYANEVVEQYAETFALNHPSVLVDARDIREVNAREVRERLGLEPGELDLVAGGPPCQGFSINAPVRSTSDYRNHLFREFLRFVEEFSPKQVLIENVPGLVSFSKGDTLTAIVEALSALGYQADVRLLYAPNFGVPQTRWRTIIIGARGATLPDSSFPAPTHSAPRRINFTSSWAGKNLVQSDPVGGLPFTSVADAISDLPPLKSGESYSAGGAYQAEAISSYQRLMREGSAGIFNHEAPRLSLTNLERLSYIPVGGNWTDIPHELLPKGMQRARTSDHTKRYGRVSPRGLASTILTKCDPHWGAYIHYEQQRVFTVREAARLQSFPDTYRFLGSRVDQFAQVGNAVPVLLAEAVGKALIENALALVG
ncbi:MAG: DNA cytosine methyltransferase [Corynebacterium sp.]|nr:DNA cytosine methyltransferase [Corynebacterium sp.]